MNRILLRFFFATCLTFSWIHAQTDTPPFSEAQVFEWWDDGIITSEEADEIFSRLEEENYDEACLLAEVYAQEPCLSTNKIKAKSTHSSKSQSRNLQTSKGSSKKTSKSTPSIIPHGRFTWKGQYDSEGHLKKNRKELQIQFYYFKLQLGSQELLSYRRDGFEAYFGQSSTLEFHSLLPLDTLWGASLLYPIGKCHLGVFLDTNKTFHTHISVKPNREYEIGATFWKFPNANAITMQAKSALGQISAWYQLGQDLPLLKILLQGEKSWISWKTTVYLHGDSIPQGLNLSKGIATNWLWSSQTINMQWAEALNTIFSAKARIICPTNSDSISARFKFSLESGPAFLRPSLSATCIEASNNCNTTEWKGIIQSSWEFVSINASVRFRYSDQENKRPRIEFGATYWGSNRSHAKLTIAFPEANPAKSFSFQNEIKLESDWLSCNFIFAFKKNKTKSLQPSYAHLQTTLLF